MSSLALSSGINRQGALELDGMIYGTAPKPFVYRQLLPAAVKLSVQSIPDDIRYSLNVKASQSSTMMRILSRISLTPDLFVEYTVTLIFIYISLWGFILAFRYLISNLFNTSDHFTDIVTLAAMAGIPAFFSYSFIYDIPTLFLFTLGLAMLVKQKWSVFLLVYFVGCWSKETMVLLTLIFFIHFFKNQRVERGLFIKLLAAQAVIFITVKVYLEINFSDNPGGLVEFHLIHNLLFGYHYTLPVFLTWIFFFILIFGNWNAKPLFLKNALWTGVPLIILTLFFGLIHEIRDYGEMYPILFGLSAQSVAQILKIPISVKEDV
jgi:hypothetical protein